MGIDFRWLLLSVLAMVPLMTFIALQDHHRCSRSPTNEQSSRFKGSLSTYSPQPPVSRGKILFMTASYTMKQYQYLWKVLEGYRELCEAGWDVDIAIQVSNGLEKQTRYNWQLQQSLYCHRIDRYMNMTFQKYGEISFGLNSRHRLIIKEKLELYDYFIYSEEDMYFTPHHMEAFIQEERKLKQFFPTSWIKYTIGYLRYEISNDSLAQVSWEYMPDKIQVVKIEEDTIRNLDENRRTADTGYYVVTNNLNQAFYIIGREQMKYLEDKCDFLSQPGRNLFLQELRRALNKDWKYLAVGISEWSSSFQQVLQCGLLRVVPIEHFQSFRLQHLTNIAQKRRLQKELLNTEDWAKLIEEKRKHPLTLKEFYDNTLYEQYNLHLMNYSLLEGKIKFVRWK